MVMIVKDSEEENPQSSEEKDVGFSLLTESTIWYKHKRNGVTEKGNHTGSPRKISLDLNNLI